MPSFVSIKREFHQKGIITTSQAIYEGHTMSEKMQKERFKDEIRCEEMQCNAIKKPGRQYTDHNKNEDVCLCPPSSVSPLV